MKYVAKYSGIYYHAAVAAACEAISSDSYYAMYNTKWGTGGILGRRVDLATGWGDWCLSLPDSGCIFVKSGKSWFTDDQLRKAVYARESVQWLSCARNLAKFDFDHTAKTVVMTIDSARHGIPELASCLRHVKPYAVMTYETWENAWEWWETKDDILRREERRRALIGAGGTIRI